MGDGAEVLDELLSGHADAGVADGQRACFLIGGDGDLVTATGVENVILRQLRVAHLFQRISGV